jgi:hypothetical protein
LIDESEILFLHLIWKAKPNGSLPHMLTNEGQLGASYPPPLFVEFNILSAAKERKKKEKKSRRMCIIGPDWPDWDKTQFNKRLISLQVVVNFGS